MKEKFVDATILYDDEILDEVKRMLREAKRGEEVVLVSPYIKLNTPIQNAIETAIGNNVFVTLLIRADTEHPIENITWLFTNRVSIKKLERLHAKIYLSADIAIVASINLHSSSYNESKECGIKFEDPRAIKELQEKVSQWMKAATNMDFKELVNIKESSSHVFTRAVPTTPKSTVLSEKRITPVTNEPQKLAKGFCIRCSKQKTYNPKYPLCDDCKKIWLKYSDETYTEKYCHRCGVQNSTSVAKPICRDCYKIDPFDKTTRK